MIKGRKEYEIRLFSVAPLELLLQVKLEVANESLVLLHFLADTPSHSAA